MYIDKRVLLCAITVLNLCLIANCRRIKRVVGGTEVDCGVQPRVASLRNATTLRHLCGATIVTTNYALTAAHCVSHQETDYLIQLNNYCTDDVGELPKIQIAKITRHPGYHRSSRAHDLALLQTERVFDDITPGEWLPNSLFGVSGECVIYGYGTKDANSDVTYDVLQAANINLVSLDDCIDALGPIAPKSNSGVMCAMTEGIDACQGDSGSPLVCEGELQALSSYGLSCAAPGMPGVYTSVGAHLKWIRDIIRDNLV